ncbi:MAG: RNA polymerase sigma factor, partial [Solirubrobacterales bacterium]|nr:RNA polymerase sigma factor [Solirubrobacterales bacterium]
MEVSALRYSGGIGLHGRSPLLKLQSDERLVALIRRGNTAAFEALVSRYESRLLAFCRHLLGSREDAEDVLQEVFAASFNAMLADERAINVRPWLYRIARNRSLNHLRRSQAIASDAMDVHLSDNGASTADKVHDREEFRLLVGDIQELPETQRTALILREMDALSYEQIAEAMETTVPSVKSLLVRARVSLAEAAQARLLSCEEVRTELGEVAEGLRRKPSVLVRRHLRTCDRCSAFKLQLRETNKALGAMLPISAIVVLKKLVFAHVGHSASSGATVSGAAGSSAAAGSVAASTSGGLVSAGIGAIATKAVAGLAAAALVTAGAVEVEHVASSHGQGHHPLAINSVPALVPAATPAHHRHHHALIPSTPATATPDLQKNTASVAKPTKHIGRSQRAHGKVATQPVLTPHGGGVKVHKHAV